MAKRDKIEAASSYHPKDADGEKNLCIYFKNGCDFRRSEHNSHTPSNLLKSI